MVLAMSSYLSYGQCATTSNIYAFNYNSKTYEVVKENKSWVDAASCAVERGGILTEINDLAEQNAIFDALDNNANITTNNTLAADGGGGAYVWGLVVMISPRKAIGCGMATTTVQVLSFGMEILAETLWVDFGAIGQAKSSPTTLITIKMA